MYPVTEAGHRYECDSLGKVPDFVYEMTGLVKLGLGNIEMTELPEGLGQMEELTTLDISYNKLEKLPKDLSKLKNLDYFAWKANKLDAPKDVKKAGLMDMKAKQIVSFKVLSGNHMGMSDACT